jgi:hypothetical protein
MKAAKVKRPSRPVNLPERAIRTEQLPAWVSRSLAAKFSLLNVRTLRRAELRGELKLFRRNSRVCGYRKEDLLSYLGLA